MFKGVNANIIKMIIIGVMKITPIIMSLQPQIDKVKEQKPLWKVIQEL